MSVAQVSLLENAFAAPPPSVDAQALLDAVLQRFHAPRDMTLMAEFLTANLPAGDLLMYGAGSHTRMVIEALAGRPDVRVVAVVDRCDGGVFCGSPIIAAAAAALRREKILVAHPVFEDDMAGALLAAGTEPDRLIRAYADLTYADAALARHRARLLAQLPARADAAIIGPSHWALVDEDAIAAAAPAGAVRLHFDVTEPFLDDGPLPCFDMDRSVTLLRDALLHLQPQAVYLHCRIETAFLALAIKRWLPSVRLIHEALDFAVLFGDAALGDWLELTPDVIALSRAADHFVAHHSDLVVSKRMGAYWEIAARRFSAPYLSYFAGMAATSPAASPPPPSGPPHILYAGILPRPEQIERFPSDYNFLGMLEALAASGQATVSIYNRLHRGEAMDPIFTAYLERYQRPELRYHRYVPPEELAGVARECHLAWLYRDWDDGTHLDMLTVLPNRVTSSIAAGLPLIIDRDWGALSGLIADFGAGLVLPRGRLDLVIDALREADLSKLWAGAQALRRHMLNHNQSVLDKVAVLLRPAGPPAIVDG